jgi:predicted nuclease of predicted toxin-antitoxin system
VRTLISELRPLVASTAAPRVYVDANLPWGAVGHMRQALGWDVLFVLEHAELRRAADREHFERARELGRTLITLDRDFGDSRRFPPALSPGVVICTAPDEGVLRRLLRHVDRTLFRAPGAADPPLVGRTLALTIDALTPAPPRTASGRRSRRR